MLYEQTWKISLLINKAIVVPYALNILFYT